MGRASKDKRDIYYRKAKEEGYRARSAYKLLQLHEEFGILRREEIRTGVVDLCAAPGSWSQVLSNHLCGSQPGSAAEACEGDEAINSEASQRPRIVAVDLQEMMPIDGVQLLQGDITSEWTAREIIRLLNGDSSSVPECSDATALSTAGAINDFNNGRGNNVSEEGKSSQQRSDCGVGLMNERNNASECVDGDNNNNNSNNNDDRNGGDAGASTRPVAGRKADLVVCDGAPDVTGMHELDEYLQHHLLLAALNITTFVLRRGGTFVTKMFRGPNTPFLVAKAEVFFRQVTIAKPKSSRNASMEAFMVCQNYDPPASYQPSFERPLTQTTSCFTPAAPALHLAAVDAQRMSSDNVNNGELHHSGVTDIVDEAYAVESVIVPFLACGDLTGYDADMCYDRGESDVVLPPVQPPLQAPYIAISEAVKERTKRQRVG
ncbi:ribosomal RNA methyltransferase, putative [Trypanosoma equiperdum]|uniref:Putative tRNA (cytidine(32)/guanosine(34)-2'-O)-methyltransferase n=2 Tax=Trypanozoon TaxID=39700 RepID=Q586L7_TRYB2|nr:ribosomal RNA methyltransferase, putative [Trypanosoma brucei brucei TREU927]AAQ15702.1 ribosomal RNA methyltransferase, putative [Trypanosoma brucei brucei TREU927]AAX79154.1 ribosomal RNA methyltransferase, putative [Trypanosoma brucei]SCU68379.1 ribosomal RNA methyltransferase, putative [Trypanosoma equiperdum]